MIIKRHKNKHKYVKFLISWYIFKVHSRKTPHKKINFFFHNHVLNTSYILALKVYSGEIYILNIMALLSFERWIEHQQTFHIKKIDDPWCIWELLLFFHDKTLQFLFSVYALFSRVFAFCWNPRTSLIRIQFFIF